ncbi:MauE/DoxX family redox-associated membrane protein [Actinomyces sp. MRS3W]|uniref:MauE/DoxX family redox-associated membrane protein n=1 Tax=Actinomyces sp. MRS3W TaxID=2800796 RepID=UPI0028FDC079|nr:MauE/DoxX family redox-associated membrane protein [Actinomyces sp. MRS3W]MDU0349200.1 MauE/DoxX family redox-associated membrane protein [Actinomyces sp. MRS3W]
MTVVAYFLGAARLLVGLLLVVSAYAKLCQDYGQGVSDVLGYRLVGRRGADLIAFLLPVVEMVIGAALLLGLLMPVSELLAAAFFLILAGVAVSALARGLVTDCGCWGSLARRRVGPTIVIRNLVMSVLLLADVFLIERQRLILVESLRSPAYAGMAIVIALLLIGRWSRRHGSSYVTFSKDHA